MNIARHALIFSTVFAFACTIEPSDEDAFASAGGSGASAGTTAGSGDDPGGSSGGEQTSGDDGGGSTSGDGGSTTGEGGSTGDLGGSTGDVGGSTGGDTGGGSTSGGGSTGGGTGGGQPGEQPTQGPWSQCLMGMDCDEGMGCLNNGPTPTDGFCTQECVAFADPSGCPDSPGGDALLSCLTLGGQNICVLDCAGGKSCPGGMTCVQETADNGTVEFCM